LPKIEPEKLDTTQSMPIDAPETMPAVPTTGDVTSPAPITPETPAKPQEEPIKQEVKTETPAQPQNVPPTTPIPPK
jgi:hypothetical protein